MTRLKGKRAVITGAGSGIGRAAALLFSDQGAAVVASDINEAGLEETVRQVRDAGGTIRGTPADVGDPERVQALVSESVKQHGGLEVFFANAGVSGGLVPLMALGVEDWTTLLRTNLIGPFLAIQSAAKHMVDHGGGSIICTASVAGLRSGAGSGHYSASKAAVINLVQTSACQLGGTGVRVNAICPGLIETGMTQLMFDAARAAGKEHKIGQLNPLRRAGQPREIASVALFLASEDSSYVNGQAIVVDGGLSASHPFVPGRML